MYAKPNQNIEEIDDSDIQFEVNDQLFFLKRYLWKFAGKLYHIQVSSKNKLIKAKKQLIKEINELYENEENNKEIIFNNTSELKEIRNKKLEGLKVRSRAIWLDNGEKPTKYFCSLENRNYNSKCMSNLIKEDSSITESEKEIIQEVKNFYKKLYTEREVTNINKARSLVRCSS